MTRTIQQMPAFKRVYKKLHSKEKTEVDNTIRLIIKDPKMGAEKKADLLGVWVYKFKINRQELLLAYEWDSEKIILLALGTHENFYKKLKRA